jgi:hypothetical protein
MTNTIRTPWQVAKEVARETGWDLETERTERNWGSVGIGPVGQHRDSDCLARSNFTVIYGDLSARFGDSVDIARFGHWAVGWVEEIIFDTGQPAILSAVEGWREKLDNYPVADEDHFSTLEWDEMCDYLASEIPSVLGSLDVLPLTEDGMQDLVFRVQSNGDYSENNVGDITEHVLDEYCAVLASE